MKRGKARDTGSDSGQNQAGDSSPEKGGTQKFLTVHSNCEIWSYMLRDDTYTSTDLYQLISTPPKLVPYVSVNILVITWQL